MIRLNGTPKVIGVRDTKDLEQYKKKQKKVKMVMVKRCNIKEMSYLNFNFTLRYKAEIYVMIDRSRIIKKMGN